MLTQIKEVLRSSFGTFEDKNQEPDQNEGTRWPDPNDKKESSDELKEYTLHEISFHDSPNDCWMVVYDLVYDVTDFLFEVTGRQFQTLMKLKK